jgi:hypothetical protein
MLYVGMDAGVIKNMSPGWRTAQMRDCVTPWLPTMERVNTRFQVVRFRFRHRLMAMEPPAG